MGEDPQAFGINLPRRQDRLQFMTGQLERLGIAFTRVDAIDAKEVDEADFAGVFAADGKYGRIPKGDMCCTLSHVRVWNAFMESGAEYGLVLEDDVELHADSSALLGDLAWLP